MNFGEITELELEAFSQFRRKYTALNPPPKAASLGWQFWLLVLTSLAAVILASLRTAEQFYRAAQLGGNTVLALIEAASVLFAVEGGIVVYSAIRAARSSHISDRMLRLGIFTMVLISTIAGLGQSARLITNLDPQVKTAFEYVLSTIIGAGASAIAWIGGEVLGSQIALAGRATSEMAGDYNNRLLSSWNNSPERRIARGELVRSVRSPNTERTNKPRASNDQANEVRTTILDYLDRTLAEENREAGPSEVARELGVSKGYAHQVIGEWSSNGGG